MHYRELDLSSVNLLYCFSTFQKTHENTQCCYLLYIYFLQQECIFYVKKGKILNQLHS